MDLNVWLPAKATVYIGGDPAKGKPPTVTITLTQPQIVIDEVKNTIKISETITK